MKVDTLPNTPGSLRTAAIVSSVLVLPFMILELVNGRGSRHDFPIVLFGFMWLIALAFIVTLMSILGSLQARNRTAPDSLRLLSRIAVLILITWIWVSLTLDQMPCFRGVPNCD
jgi:cation transport ATPase